MDDFFTFDGKYITGTDLNARYQLLPVTRSSVTMLRAQSPFQTFAVVAVSLGERSMEARQPYRL